MWSQKTASDPWLLTSEHQPHGGVCVGVMENLECFLVYSGSLEIGVEFAW